MHTSDTWWFFHRSEGDLVGLARALYACTVKQHKWWHFIEQELSVSSCYVCGNVDARMFVWLHSRKVWVEKKIKNARSLFELLNVSNHLLDGCITVTLFRERDGKDAIESSSFEDADTFEVVEWVAECIGWHTFLVAEKSFTQLVFSRVSDMIKETVKVHSFASKQQT